MKIWKAIIFPTPNQKVSKMDKNHMLIQTSIINNNPSFWMKAGFPAQKEETVTSQRERKPCPYVDRLALLWRP